jgi:hypothetical protein
MPFSGGDGDSLERQPWPPLFSFAQVHKKIWGAAKFNLNSLNINAEKWQYSLKDRRDTDQYHEQFKELG